MNIEALSKLSDDELREKLGLNRELQRAKEGIEAALKLEGEARAIAERKIKDMLTPTVSSYSLEWLAKDAKREALSANEQMASTDPGSIMD